MAKTGVLQQTTVVIQMWHRSGNHRTPCRTPVFFCFFFTLNLKHLSDLSHHNNIAKKCEILELV